MPKGLHKENLAGDLAALHAIRDKHGIKRPLTQAEIAAAVGCSPQNIREIELNALRKLRHPSRANKLKDAA